MMHNSALLKTLYFRNICHGKWSCSVLAEATLSNFTGTECQALTKELSVNYLCGKFSNSQTLNTMENFHTILKIPLNSHEKTFIYEYIIFLNFTQQSLI